MALLLQYNHLRKSYHFKHYLVLKIDPSIDSVMMSAQKKDFIFFFSIEIMMTVCTVLDELLSLNLHD